MTVAPAQAWYIYSVLPAGTVAPQGAAVLPGAQIAALQVGLLTVLASLVPRALFDRGSASQRTEDPDWMAARIAAHHAVNAAAAAAGACLPLSFGVLFSSVERLQEWLQPRETALAWALTRVAQREEWALSILQDAGAHENWLDRNDPALRALAEAASGAGEGTAFLIARRRDKFRATTAAAHLSTVAVSIATRLAEADLGVLPEPPRAGRPAWTVLAPSASPNLTGLIQTLADELAPTGLSLRLTGPWPAYAFARTALNAVATHD